MSEHVSLLKDLRSGKECNLEAVAAIEDLESRLAAAEIQLRDHFAGSALQGMDLKDDGSYSPNGRKRKEPETDAAWVATAAYRYADAMLRER